MSHFVCVWLGVWINRLGPSKHSWEKIKNSNPETSSSHLWKFSDFQDIFRKLETFYSKFPGQNRKIKFSKYFLDGQGKFFSWFRHAKKRYRSCRFPNIEDSRMVFFTVYAVLSYNTLNTSHYSIQYVYTLSHCTIYCILRNTLYYVPVRWFFLYRNPHNKTVHTVPFLLSAIRMLTFLTKHKGDYLHICNGREHAVI